MVIWDELAEVCLTARAREVWWHKHSFITTRTKAQFAKGILEESIRRYTDNEDGLSIR